MQTGDKVVRPNNEILLPMLDDRLAKFIITYDDRKNISYPVGMYAGECLSLVKLWIAQTFSIIPPSSGTGTAYGYWKNFPKPLPDIFMKVSRNDGIESGDIVIWNKSTVLPHGHISIAVSIFENFFISFDQNWLGYKKCNLVLHDFYGLAGYLRPKV